MSTMTLLSDQFTLEELEAFHRDGFFICRGLMPEDYVLRMLSVATRDSGAELGDVEYEADVQYPGSPDSRDAVGGRTIRRLRQAFSRDPVFASLVKEPFLLRRLQQLLGDRVVMPLAHHNCIMTKNPGFSSDTGWHQDIRYWSFERGDLINVWIALTRESEHNGCLKVIPGTHHERVAADRLDELQFLRTDLPENQDWLAAEIPAEMSPGDVLFFHARCLHSATRNYSDRTKCSAVFTFRAL
ncbi:MAG: phytanoyl-CoA dioxygenase family protein, partial [Planctomycetaceae bacterium]|nr:phytanoyl-CoA dioxygenase family protein [Planctomycetaceae bacterium]